MATILSLDFAALGAGVLGGLAGVMVVLTGTLGLEVLLALLPGHAARGGPRSGQSPGGAPDLTWEHLRVAVLVPAHNEALLIGPTLGAIVPQLKPQDRVIVVADNCEDETAALARSAGATVLERHDLDRRGKGYALDYGLRVLQADPPDVLLIVDADCHCHPGSLPTLAHTAHQTQRPIQSLYLLDSPPDPSLKDLISAFAMTVKNGVRMRGLGRVGWPCPLGGTGMAFPWAALATVDLASGHIVEDMKLGLDLAIAGYPPLFWGGAKVTGSLPSGRAASTSQRTRWEHGHLQVLRDYVPVLFATALRQGRIDLGVMALDLAIPPLSLLVLLWVGLAIATGLLAVLGGSGLPLVLMA
ncbi:MAG: glycosyltransferase family 2 protein, partial [Prochlorothrix sp.]